MRIMVLAAGAMALAASAGPAAAQYNGVTGGGYGGYTGRPDYGGPPPSQPGTNPYRLPPPGYGDPDRRGAPRVAGPPRRLFCVTARGACPAGDNPAGASCGCDTPRYGPQRGTVK